MTRGTICAICIGAAFRISRNRRSIGRWRLIAESIWPCPCPDAAYERLDLLISEHSPRTLCKSRHRCAGYSVCSHPANHAVVGNCQKNRISQSHGGSALTVQAVASCAVLSIECVEVEHFTRWHDGRFRPMDAGGTAAGGTTQECDDHKRNENGPKLHCRPRSPFSSSITPGASIPART